MVNTDTGVSGTIVPFDGRVQASVTKIYGLNNTYGLVARVLDAGTAVIVAQSSAVVVIGLSKQRALRLHPWRSKAYNTGAGLMVDESDVSAVPVGPVFDLTCQANKIPDSFLVNCPAGNQVLDTGWFGSMRYDGSPQYPCGVTSVNNNTNLFAVHNVFRRRTHEALRVTVIGPWPSNWWGYEVRAAASPGLVLTTRMRRVRMTRPARQRCVVTGSLACLAAAIAGALAHHALGPWPAAVA